MKVELILLTFLEKKDASAEYKEAVESLAQTIDKDGQLETDGISPFRDCFVGQMGGGPPLVQPGALMKTCRMGNRGGPPLAQLCALKKTCRMGNRGGPPVFQSCSRVRTFSLDTRPDPGTDEELCRRIAAQLRELGDQFERESLIKQEVVETLTHEILNNALTESRFETAVKSLLSNVPAGIEPEKASLTVAMLLTRKIGEHIPSLLHSCFSTATNFIQNNYNSYLESQR